MAFDEKMTLWFEPRPVKDGMQAEEVRWFDLMIWFPMAYFLFSIDTLRSIENYGKGLFK